MGWRGGGEGRTTRTRRPTPALALRFWLRVFFLSLFLSLVRSFELPFFSCLRFRLQRFPFFLLLLSPSFLLERSKPLIFGYVFLHFCSLFAFDLIVGSGCHPSPLFSLSFSLSVPAMCCLLTFNEMSTKDQALCDFSPTLTTSLFPSLSASSRRQLGARLSAHVSDRISVRCWHSPWHSFSIIFRLTKCTQTANTASSVLTCPRPFVRLRFVHLRLVRWQH